MAPFKGGQQSEVASVIMFGGCSDIYCKHLLNDTWILRSAGWTQLTITGPSPAARRSFKMAYLGYVVKTVPQVLLFGGACQRGLDDLDHDGWSCQKDEMTWSFDGSWHRVVVDDPSSKPTPRYKHSMASYSAHVPDAPPLLQVVILSGIDGLDSAKTAITNTRTFTFTPSSSVPAKGTWTVSVVSTPSARSAFSMTSMSSTPGVGQQADIPGTIVLFGGQLAEQNVECNNFISDETWEWQLDTHNWVKQSKKHEMNWPIARHWHTMVGMQDQLGNRFALLYGGLGGCGNTTENFQTFSDTWMYVPNNTHAPASSQKPLWTDISFKYKKTNKLIMPVRKFHAMSVYDVGLAVVFGGSDDADNGNHMPDTVLLFNVTTGWRLLASSTGGTSTGDSPPSGRVALGEIHMLLPRYSLIILFLPF